MPTVAGVGERALGWKASVWPAGTKLVSSLDIARAMGFGPESIGKPRVTGPVPASFSWRSQTCPVLDQGQTPACVGGGTSALTYIGLKELGITIDPLNPNAIPSPGYTFKGAKTRERAAFLATGASVNIPLPSLDDGTGVGAADAVAFMMQEGVIPMKGPTPDGRNFDLWTTADIANIHGATSNMGIELAGPDLIRGEMKLLTGEAILDTSVTNFVSLLQSMLLVCPIGWGGYVDSQVFNYTAGGEPFGPYNPSDSNKGGHFMAVIGWRPSVLNDGTVDWEIQNDWGTSYGDQGFCYGRQDWAQTGAELLSWKLQLVTP